MKTYKVVRYSTQDFTITQIEADLNVWGNAGWTLVSVTGGGMPFVYTAFFIK
jgi:hypothetical protein